jgi:hypothetical protein
MVFLFISSLAVYFAEANLQIRPESLASAGRGSRLRLPVILWSGASADGRRRMSFLWAAAAVFACPAYMSSFDK